MLKKKIIDSLNEIVREKIDTAQKEIDSLQASKENETKSSMGDKYETGRAMIELEYEQNLMQLHQAQKLKIALNELNLSQKTDHIKKGSLVVTNHGTYFISVGLGKLTIDNEIFHAISPDSPLGSFLVGKSKNESGEFMGKQYEIINIL